MVRKRKKVSNGGIDKKREKREIAKRTGFPRTTLTIFLKRYRRSFPNGRNSLNCFLQYHFHGLRIPLPLSPDKISLEAKVVSFPVWVRERKEKKRKRLRRASDSVGRLLQGEYSTGKISFDLTISKDFYWFSAPFTSTILLPFVRANAHGEMLHRRSSWVAIYRN